MRVSEVEVAAGATFNDPHEDFRNHRPSVKLTGVLEPGDDPASSVKALQAAAAQFLAAERQRIIEARQAEEKEADAGRKAYDHVIRIARLEFELEDFREKAKAGETRCGGMQIEESIARREQGLILRRAELGTLRARYPDAVATAEVQASRYMEDRKKECIPF